MRIYDHLIRVFQFGPWESAGDLRRGNMGVFGSVQSTCEMFARYDAHEAISNGTPLQPPESPVRLGNFAVSLVFWPMTPNDWPADKIRTKSSLQMEDLCVDGLSVWVGGVDVGVRMAVRFVCETGRVIDSPGETAVTLKPGGPFGVKLAMNRDLVEHLNGYVLTDGAWAPGDPMMTRVIRVSCDVDPG